MTFTDRLINVLFAMDCFIFALVTLGTSYPSESISSAAYRAEKMGKSFGKVRPWIDRLFWFQPQHCQHAYGNALANLPPDERIAG